MTTAILDTIIAHKQRELAGRKTKIKVNILEQSLFFERTCFSLINRLKTGNTSGIIAEFKRKSPSKGVINTNAAVEKVTRGYTLHGAAGLSVLTDTHFFNGVNEDLVTARNHNQIPVLRKDFIIDEYQIIEAKAIGADVILLIAECLTATQIKAFTYLAHSLGLEVLLELHSEKQLKKISSGNRLIGINNRDLKTFKVNLSRSITLAHQLPANTVIVAESGISNPQTVLQLQQAGFSGFLMGEHFMKTKNPVAAFQHFITALKQEEKSKPNENH